MSDERWAPFPNYEGLYEVSDLGRVRSLDRMGLGRNGHPRLFKGRILTPCAGNSGRGYLQVTLRRVSGPPRSVVVHRAVLLAFLGQPPEGMEACHGPRGKDVNTLANLRWDTRAANVLDKARFGRTVEGEKNGNSLLTEEKVAEIRASDARNIDLARRFGVTDTLISLIRKGKAWRHSLPAPKSLERMR